MSKKQLVVAIVTLSLFLPSSLAEDQRPGKSLHQLMWEQHKDTPTSESLREGEPETIIPLQKRSRTSPCATVFGYLPYWARNTANLQYDKLTHLACFGVEVNANGTLGSDHYWPWTTIINNAHAAGVKVILTAICFEPSDINTLITNTTNKNRFFVNIRNKMLEGSADGLNIDFEGNGAYTSQINNFMAELTNYLHAEIPGCEVTYAGPSVNWGGWNLKGLADSCDGVFIMGYAFWGSWSSSSGPNAPLTGGGYNITNTVVSQYAQADPAKLILGVPYYGHHWETTSSTARSAATDFIGSPGYTSAQNGAETYGRIWESTSQTPWYRYYDGSTWHQIWYDDAQSLGLKYDLAMDHGFQGIGMWALGSDNGRQELWNLIDEKIGQCNPPLPYFDFDDNGILDSEDLMIFEYCMVGPGEPYPAFCTKADSDEDGDIDLQDFAEFTRLYAQ